VLFNSYGFILLFLPVALGGFFLLGRSSPWLAAAFLALASLAFYGWWDVSYLPLLLGSIAFNFVVGRRILLLRDRTPAAAKTWLAGGIAGNLLLLGYYKYADFFVANLNATLGSGFEGPGAILPIGISFFTFTQIAYLADAWQGKAGEYEPVHYGLFVTYFPHLVAGPILHHREMMPQFRDPAIYRPVAENIAVGLSIFVIGLFKKVILADGIAEYSMPFAAAASGKTLTFVEAWCAALSYTMQLYFDFSGYSDMAVGLSRMFGVHLPLNFNSPYKAESIIEFWRRWHMTLSRFLRDYLYIPLGGNRKGPARRHVNLMITMALGGLWHGANWTFIAWGALHGIYLVINHLWSVRAAKVRRSSLPGRIASTALTFLAVVVAWVFFRAENIETALAMLCSMAGLNDLGTLSGFRHNVIWLAACALIVWGLPNTQEFMGRRIPNAAVASGGLLARFPVIAWHPSRAWLAAILALGLASLASLNRVSEFLYFQF
jgi:D-alanyl-lipoteichoic acid acyltransferase DltB (MBOAT superfamily)